MDGGPHRRGANQVHRDSDEAAAGRASRRSTHPDRTRGVVRRRRWLNSGRWLFSAVGICHCRVDDDCRFGLDGAVSARGNVGDETAAQGYLQQSRLTRSAYPTLLLRNAASRPLVAGETAGSSPHQPLAIGFCFASWVAQSRSLSTGRRVNTRHSLGLECEAINGG